MVVVPAINAQTFEEAKAQLQKIASIFSSDTEDAPERWIHLDIVDGKFAPNITWGTPEEFRELITSYQLPITVNFEIHLMVQNPELVVNQWLEAGAKRIIVHVEAMNDSEIITDACQSHGASAMLAAIPETPVEKLLEEESEFKEFQILSVPAGKAGQAFDTKVLEKIRMLKDKLPGATIEIDGGITPQTIDLCREAGADIAVSSSYILRSADPQKAFEELQMATNGDK